VMMCWATSVDCDHARQGPGTPTAAPDDLIDGARRTACIHRPGCPRPQSPTALGRWRPTYPTAGGCRGYGIMVLTIADDTIAALTGFPDPVRGATSAPRL
jgi:hypothetical protein